MKYHLMKKNTILGELEINENGDISKYQFEKDFLHLLPFTYRYQLDGIKKWWQERRVSDKVFQSFNLPRNLNLQKSV